MPNRILREGIIDSEPVNELSPQAELLYRRLMSKADDYGRFSGNPSLVLAACYPLQLDRVTRANVSEWLAECAQVSLITLYELEGKKYLEIKNFGQRVRTDSKFPAPPCAQMSAKCAQMPARREHDADKCPPSAAHARARSESESESNADTDAKASAKSAPVAALPAPEIDYDFRYEALYANHPVPGFKAEGQFRYVEIVSTAVHPQISADAIDRVHTAWVAFWKANPTEYKPGIGKFFEEGYYLRNPDEVKTRSPAKGRKPSFAENVENVMRREIETYGRVL